MRSPIGGVVVAALVAALGAVVLGEYELIGVRAVVAGLIFGVLVGEVVATVARQGDPALQVAAALLAEAGLVWATWISTGHDLGLASTAAWIGVVLGGGAAALWLRSAGRRGARSPDGSAPAPGD